MIALLTSKMRRRRMSPSQGLFFANGLNNCSIQCQSRDSGASNWADADHFSAIPAKMQSPRISTRVENGGSLRGFRIQGRLAGSLSQRTGNAGKSQIIQNCLAPGKNRNSVVNMKNRFLAGLGETTILASVFSPMDYLTPKVRRDVHAATSAGCSTGVNEVEAAKACRQLPLSLWPRVFRLPSERGLRPACQARPAAGDEHPLAGGTLPGRPASPFVVGWLETYLLSFSTHQFSRTVTRCPSLEFDPCPLPVKIL
jgi:hypothetical protein